MQEEARKRAMDEEQAERIASLESGQQTSAAVWMQQTLFDEAYLHSWIFANIRLWREDAV